MRCSQCGGDLDRQDANQLITSISGSIMGDGQTHSRFFCSRCGLYMLEVYFDRFLAGSAPSLGTRNVVAPTTRPISRVGSIR